MREIFTLFNLCIWNGVCLCDCIHFVKREMRKKQFVIQIKWTNGEKTTLSTIVGASNQFSSRFFFSCLFNVQPTKHNNFFFFGILALKYWGNPRWALCATVSNQIEMKNIWVRAVTRVKRNYLKYLKIICDNMRRRCSSMLVWSIDICIMYISLFVHVHDNAQIQRKHFNLVNPSFMSRAHTKFSITFLHNRKIDEWKSVWSLVRVVCVCAYTLIYIYTGISMKRNNISILYLYTESTNVYYFVRIFLYIFLWV